MIRKSLICLQKAMPEGKKALDTEYFPKRWQEPIWKKKEVVGGYRKAKSVFSDLNIGLRCGGLLLDAYLGKAFELDIYLTALSGK